MTTPHVLTQLPAPRAVLWDLDGTLVDSEPLWTVALNDVATELGRPLSSEARSEMTGTDGPTTMRMLADYTGVRMADEELLALRDRVEQHVHTLLMERTPVLPGAEEILRALRRTGTPMALVTSSPQDIAEIALTALGSDRFDVVVTAADVRHRKPDPEPYLLAARRLEVPPTESWAVEDSPSGADAAETAGCTVLLSPGALPTAHAPGRVALSSLTDIPVRSAATSQ
ncbi:HAD family phosphatase [Lipingzhangella sp. LS1_29]|uniref:HAD family phosphatase n=1 Tax=Lipingzhangella rawalii TaxID=2055835 RepID=A0ABU2HBE4_9ACTN|nr:HAD family phosphatase [Lipingzhangella rawalii]MDS1272651.1 HAD family phosphatase [Lipingzhangella rawalii]